MLAKLWYGLTGIKDTETSSLLFLSLTYRPSILRKDTIYYLQGTDSQTFYPVKSMSSRGVESNQGFVIVDEGIIFIAYDGLYLFNGQTSDIFTEEKVHALFHNETVNGISPINKANLGNSWLVFFGGKIFFGYPDGNETIGNFHRSSPRISYSRINVSDCNCDWFTS